jgi:D-alanyl-D-alanine dipeptidase
MNGSKNSRVPAFSRLAVLILIAAIGGVSCAPGGGAMKRRAVALAKKFDLVEVPALVPGVQIDLRYGTRHNVAGRALYHPGTPCLLRRATAEKLRTAQALLAAQGYGLRIWDAWRPPEVHVLLLHHGGHTGMFQNLDGGWSRHCAGLCVDVTLVDRQGREVRMPTGFDQDFEFASSHYTGGDPEIAGNLARLQRAMRAAGLEPVKEEWWHFDDTDFLNQGQRVIGASELGLPIL